jgi:hypothetical protein
MSNQRKRRRPNGKSSTRQRPRIPRGPQAPYDLDPDVDQMIWLSMALGASMARKAVEILDRYWDLLEVRQISADGTVDLTFNFPEPDGTVLATILNAARNFQIVSKSTDPERRTGDAILQLEKLAAMVARLEAAA